MQTKTNISAFRQAIEGFVFVYNPPRQSACESVKSELHSFVHLRNLALAPGWLLSRQGRLFSRAADSGCSWPEETIKGHDHDGE